MQQPEVSWRECRHCNVRDQLWSMGEAAEHWMAAHAKALEILKTAVVLAQAAKLGVGPWQDV